ncbi:hypothetical protein D9M68_899570 [compost metagenome]
MEGQGVAVLLPQPVGHAPGLQGLEPLEVQEGLQQRADRRIALLHRLQVRLGGGDDAGIGGEGRQGDLAHRHGPQFGVAQLARDLETQRPRQVVMRQDDGVQLRRQARLLARGVGGGGAQLSPQVRSLGHDFQLGHRAS